MVNDVSFSCCDIFLILFFIVYAYSNFRFISTSINRLNFEWMKMTGLHICLFETWYLTGTLKLASSHQCPTSAFLFDLSIPTSSSFWSNQSSYVSPSLVLPRERKYSLKALGPLSILLTSSWGLWMSVFFFSNSRFSSHVSYDWLFSISARFLKKGSIQCNSTRTIPYDN